MLNADYRCQNSTMVSGEEREHPVVAINSAIRKPCLASQYPFWFPSAARIIGDFWQVLWPESGWKAVPLVDLIEANSVKRAYQKALLRLHPDKLQQKGAAFNEKYTAEKVFDILQVFLFFCHKLSLF